MENYPEKVWIENEDADHNEGCGFWYEWKAFRASKAYIREDLSDTSSSYTYVGKDGKPVLARDLENERDELRAQLSQARNAALDEALRVIAEWEETMEREDSGVGSMIAGRIFQDVRALKSPEQEK